VGTSQNDQVALHAAVAIREVRQLSVYDPKLKAIQV
jgi:hypothetical protein